MINKYTPKPHQIKAIDAVFNHENGLITNDRTQMIMACGTGKTFRLNETYGRLKTQAKSDTI